MVEQTNKIFSFLKFFTFTILVWTWQISNKLNTCCKLWNFENGLNNVLNGRISRLLRGENNFYSEQRYEGLKKRIMDLLEEDDHNFEKRLRECVQDDQFKKEFNALTNEVKVTNINTLIHDAHFMKQTKPLEYFVNYVKYENSEKPIDYLKSENDEEEEIFNICEANNFIMNKKYRSRKKSKLSKIIKFLKKLDATYEKNLIKFLSCTNGNDARMYKSKYKIALKVFSPVGGIILSAILLNVLCSGQITAFISFAILILSTIYFGKKLQKAIKRLMD
ncbi:Plasmodium exported protein, unknown function [Plasmodium ovale]|uniref:Pv-fam-d protein n=1 Tax=Plasmodium ovale TaxID=36330 RepID=A0A1D3JDB5_PLAOA|nr:Plasmodium exported protein, unknown function [Plasmodium ovale]